MSEQERKYRDSDILYSWYDGIYTPEDELEYELLEELVAKPKQKRKNKPKKQLSLFGKYVISIIICGVHFMLFAYLILSKSVSEVVGSVLFINWFFSFLFLVVRSISLEYTDSTQPETFEAIDHDFYFMSTFVLFACAAFAIPFWVKVSYRCIKTEIIPSLFEDVK